MSFHTETDTCLSSFPLKVSPDSTYEKIYSTYEEFYSTNEKNNPTNGGFYPINGRFYFINIRFGQAGGKATFCFNQKPQTRHYDCHISLTATIF